MKKSPEWWALKKVADEEWQALEQRARDATSPSKIGSGLSYEQYKALRESVDKTFDAEREELEKKNQQLLDAQQAKDEAEIVVHLVWWLRTELLIKFSIEDLIDKVLNSNLASLVTISSEKTMFAKTDSYGRPERIKFVEILFETTLDKVLIRTGTNLGGFLAEYARARGLYGRTFINGWPDDGRLGMSASDMKSIAELTKNIDDYPLDPRLSDLFPKTDGDDPDPLDPELDQPLDPRLSDLLPKTDVDDPDPLDPESLLWPTEPGDPDYFDIPELDQPLEPPPAEAGDEATGAPVAEVEDEAAEPLEEPTEEQKPKVWSSGRDPSQRFEPKK